MNDSHTDYNSKCPYMFNVVCTVAASLLTVVGLVGNIMIIMSFYKTRTLRTSPNSYIVNMATSDLTLTFLAGTWFILEYFTGFKIFNRFSTKSTTGDFFMPVTSFCSHVLVYSFHNEKFTYNEGSIYCFGLPSEDEPNNNKDKNNFTVYDLDLSTWL